MLKTNPPHHADSHVRKSGRRPPTRAVPCEHDWSSTYDSSDPEALRWLQEGELVWPVRRQRSRTVAPDSASVFGARRADPELEKTFSKLAHEWREDTRVIS